RRPVHRGGDAARHSRGLPGRRPVDLRRQLRWQARPAPLPAPQDHDRECSRMSDVVTLALRTAPAGALELAAVTPDRLAQLAQREIAALPVRHGGRAAALGDFFVVQGERAARVRLEGDLRLAEGLGAARTGGEGGGVRRAGVRRRPLDEARLDCRVRPGRPPGHLPLRLHLPAAARAAAAPLSAGAAGARRRRPLDHGALRPLLRRPSRARKGRNAAMGGGVSGDGLGLNERAWLIADQMVANADALRIGARTLANGARVIDAGIDRPGGYGAGLALARL